MQILFGEGILRVCTQTCFSVTKSGCEIEPGYSGSGPTAPPTCPPGNSASVRCLSVEERYCRRVFIKFFSHSTKPQGPIPAQWANPKTQNHIHNHPQIVRRSSEASRSFFKRRKRMASTAASRQTGDKIKDPRATRATRRRWPQHWMMCSVVAFAKHSTSEKRLRPCTFGFRVRLPFFCLAQKLEAKSLGNSDFSEKLSIQHPQGK